ncbi:MAG: DUF3568 family protein [Candidatus Loosdrechtia sp.]|uniref:DUF3568 family protein n=1 Tax=Candidatus Loosdrechtia sp. TaxID=3101272 RepID=UPI003A6E33FB|nr:MAG: DUF3568 family protein [Candidatus Jettenia sp. AMX2]
MAEKPLRIVLLGIILSSVCGCVAVPLIVGGGAGAGTVAYLKGELKSLEEASLDKTWQATHKALKDLEFIITSEEKNSLSAKAVARGTANKRVEINLKNVSGNLTEVKIRVGIFGEESLSRLILERIKKYLNGSL